MNTTFLSFYLTVGVVIYCVWVTGLEQTLLIVEYGVKRCQIIWIEWRLERLRKRLYRQLINSSK